jgi:uncharacterized small protein (TIGR04563 family)
VSERPLKQQRHQSFYMSELVRLELHAEAKRLGKSLSWVAQRAWILARLKIKSIPGEPAS